MNKFGIGKNLIVMSCMAGTLVLAAAGCGGGGGR